MPPLIFRPARRQLGSLLLGTFVLAAVAAGAMTSHLDGEDPSGRLLGLGIGLGCGAIIAGWAAARYSQAVTVCGPDGISGRGLAGRWHCDWHDVEQISIRRRISSGAGRPAVSTYTPVVSVTGGGQFSLAAPVAGGIMPDPAFEAKVADIRRYWHQATGRHGGTAAPPPVTVAPVARFPRDRRSAARFVLGLITLVTIVATAAIPVAAAEGATALRVRLGQGVPGYYTAYGNACPSACYWVGVFSPAAPGGVARAGVTIASGSDITRLGTPVRAVDAGSAAMVYPVGGGTSWIPLSIVLAVTLAGYSLLLLIALVLRSRRGRPPGVRPHSAATQRSASRTPPSAGVRKADRAIVPLAAARQHGPGQDPVRHAASLATAAGVVIVIAAAGYLVARHPPPSWTPTATARACASYGQWLLAQPASGSLGTDPALLDRAAQEAPRRRLRTDLITLAVAARASASQGVAGVLAAEAAASDLATVRKDCS